MIHTFVVFRVGKGEEFESIHRTLLVRMSAMPGCIDVDVHRSAGEPLEYMVHGRGRARPHGIGHIKAVPSSDSSSPSCQSSSIACPERASSSRRTCS